jgi:hypothetical protein
MDGVAAGGDANQTAERLSMIAGRGSDQAGGTFAFQWRARLWAVIAATM